MERQKRRYAKQELLKRLPTLAFVGACTHAIADVANVSQFDGAWQLDVRTMPNPTFQVTVPVQIKDGTISGTVGQPGTLGYVAIDGQITYSRLVTSARAYGVTGEMRGVSAAEPKIRIVGFFNVGRRFGDIHCAPVYSGPGTGTMQTCTGIFRQRGLTSTPTAQRAPTPSSELPSSAPPSMEPTARGECSKMGSGSATVQCVEAERQQADMRLNQEYKAAMARLDSNAQERLRNDERAWIKERDKLCGVPGANMREQLSATSVICARDETTKRTAVIQVFR
ncbi:lysozyme inhibitor LprI family protein [Caballeronia sp. GAWG2-1]|uniref:lysozyme inhibitor LprI family protein n=1 Tax=Caballeronia sp. GAWG2-1 TaxID=2921744 RepID=UPI00202979DD|nr:lysozyme inhibitor LprI family protein [Caballeronia sp. GAWG2-1]